MEKKSPRKAPTQSPRLTRGPDWVAQSFAATVANDGDDLFGGQWKSFVPDDEVEL